jgi:mono/diheme cytochrome c family protein
VQAWPWLVLLAFALGACGDASDRAGLPATVQFERAAAELVPHGERLSKVLGCSGCHGQDLRGEDWSEPGFGRLWTANLTRAVPRYSDAQLAAIIRRGARPDRPLWEMPSHLFAQLTEDDMAAVIAFLRSRPPSGIDHPAPAFGDEARREIVAGTFLSSPVLVKKHGAAWPPDAGPEHALGRYVVRATCAECHGMDLRGGQPHPTATPRPDLRMVAAYELRAFQRLLRIGKAAGDREVGLMSEVARGRYRHLTNREVAAVYAYLRKVGETDRSR